MWPRKQAPPPYVRVDGHVQDTIHTVDGDGRDIYMCRDDALAVRVSGRVCRCQAIYIAAMLCYASDDGAPRAAGHPRPGIRSRGRVEPIRVSNKTAVSNFLPWIRIAREEMPDGCCFVLIFILLPLLIGSPARPVFNAPGRCYISPPCILFYYYQGFLEAYIHGPTTH